MLINFFFFLLFHITFQQQNIQTKYLNFFTDDGRPVFNQPCSDSILKKQKVRRRLFNVPI
jgi:hypothetical protein